ncbi:MAG TPA: MFS transporter [Anaerolineae bacterium]|nr:MFS transporter [Anaerolineae bacterium]
MSDSGRQQHLLLQIICLTLGRWLLNSSLRFVYPFLPAIARGLGPTVSYTSLVQLVSWRNLTGLASPFLGIFLDHYPRRHAMLLALTLFALSSFALLIWPTYAGIALAMLTVALAKALYDPAIQAYLGDQIPYAQRGRFLGITELGWALALLIGAPLAGWLLARYHWSTPFLVYGALAIPVAIGIYLLIPPTPPASQRQLPSFHLLRRYPATFFAFIYIFLIMGSIDLLFIAYGPWMESAFQLDITRLGLTAGLIGGSELLGELIVINWIDRWGKRPVVITAALLNATSYLLLPYLSYNFWGALLLLALIFCTFEITAVGGLPLMTEIAPPARGFVLTLLLAAISLGRAVGAALGAWLWQQFGLTGVAFVASAAMFLAVTILTLTIKEATDDYQH